MIVTFEDHFARDFCFSKAKNLADFHDEQGAPTAGIRIDVPPYLMSTFKLLSEHGYEIRSTHGRETRRYVNNLSLFLEVRLPGQTKWIKVRPDQARAHMEEKDRTEYSIITKSQIKI